MKAGRWDFVPSGQVERQPGSLSPRVTELLEHGFPSPS